MLLTSSQVSFAVSSVIIFLFTTALFLAGYVLQQQTVRDLRAAIKPQLVRTTGPDLYLPPQFREDGYLVDAVIVDTSPSSSKTEDSAADEVGDDMIGATRWQKKAAREKKKARRAGQKPVGDEIEVGNGSGDKEKEEKQLSRAERRKLIKDQILADGDGEDFKGYRRRMW